MKKFKYIKEGILFAKDKEEAKEILCVGEDDSIETDIYEEVEGMERWDLDIPDEEQKYVKITSITVPTEYDKEQLLLAFEYIHDSLSVDLDYLAVNTISHMYLNPFAIKVEND